MTVLTRGDFVLFHLENELENYTGDPAKESDPKQEQSVDEFLKTRNEDSFIQNSSVECALHPKL